MALLICLSPNPSTSLYGHAYARRRGVLNIFVWTRQVVLTSQSMFRSPLGKIHQLMYWKLVPSPFPPPLVRTKPVCSSSGWQFRSEDRLLCVAVQYLSDMFHACSARTLQTRSRKQPYATPLWWCWSHCVMRNPNARTAKKCEFGPLGIGINLYCKLQFYYISLGYMMAPLPTGVYTRPHLWSVAANCSPEMSYDSTPTQSSHGTTSAMDEPCICTRLRDFPGCSVVAG